MRALLLAAGIGSRLRPITNTIPKCLVPVNGRPLIDYWLDYLESGDFERFLINTHHLPEKVREHISSSYLDNKIDLVHEDKLLGTGGTILSNRDYFRDEPFLVAHADNLTQFSPAELFSAFRNRPRGCVMALMAFRTDDPHSCGILELDDNNRQEI